MDLMKHLIEFLKLYDLQLIDGRKQCSKDLWNKYGIQIQYDDNNLIVRYQRWSDSFSDKNEITKYCRGTILNIKTLQPVAYTFRAKDSYEEFTNQQIKFSDVTIYKYYDGTMVNLYYNSETDEWKYATKGRLDAKNSKWFSSRSFQELFQETCEIDYNKLDKNVCYSFVLQHKENKIVSNIDTNRVVLVLARLVDTGTLINLDTLSDLVNDNLSLPEKVDKSVSLLNDYDELDKYVEGLDFNEAGVIIFGPNDLRTRLMSTDYINASTLRGNYQNKMLNIVSLNHNQIEDYLYYFPEDYDIYDKVEVLSRRVISSIFYFYQRIKVQKIYTDIPVHLRKVIHMVHQLYETRRLSNEFGKNAAITHRVLKGYFHSLPNKHILEILTNHDKYLIDKDKMDK